MQNNSLRFVIPVLLGALGCCAGSVAYAQSAPVEERPLPAFKHLSMEQRVRQLELAQENEQSLQLPRKIDLLLEEIQQLRDKVEALEHRLKGLPVSSLPPVPESVPLVQGESSTAPMAPIVKEMAAPEGLTAAAPREPLIAIDPSHSQERYDAAYALLQDRKYPEALKKFQAFVKEDHEEKLRGNAWYWIGELYLLQKNRAMAEQAFKTVIQEHPSHLKVAESLLKLGYIAYDQKEYALAANWLQKVKAEFPDSATARLADVRLQRLQQEGH